MNITEWYAVSLGCLAALPIAARLLSLNTLLFDYAYYFQRQSIYPSFLYGFGISSFHLVFLAFLIGNAVCLTVHPQNVSGFTRRSGTLSAINMMPLFLGAHMNSIISFSGISLPAYTRFHRWVGMVALCEGLIHIAAAAPNYKLDLHKIKGIGGLTTGIAFAVLFCLGPCRRYFHEIVSGLHVILSAAIIGATYLHVHADTLLKPPVIYLTVAVIVQIVMSGVRLSQILYRNIKYGKPLNRASIRAITFKRRHGHDIPVLDAVHVHVQLTRPWQPHGGQYAYLCLPGMNLTSIVQSHPFYVLWTYRDENNDYYVVFLVQRHAGFTEKLLLHTGTGNSSKAEMKAVIEGPYGKELELDLYGTVILFATGIGITGQLPYVSKLLEGYQQCDVKTRRIVLFWEVKSELHAAWVAEMMQELLEKDTRKILDIRLFVLGDFVSSETQKGDHVHVGERIDLTYDAMNVDAIVKSELKKRKGQTIISLCTNKERSTQIRKIVRQMDNTIHLAELDFDPQHCGKPEFKFRFGNVAAESA